MIEVRVELNRIDEVFDRIQRLAVPAAVDAVSEDVHREAFLRAPVDTGELAESLDLETLYESPGEKAIQVAPHTENAHDLYQELGTSKMAAQPYLRPAAEVVGVRMEKVAGQAAKAALGGLAG